MAGKALSSKQTKGGKSPSKPRVSQKTDGLKAGKKSKKEEIPTALALFAEVYGRL